MPRRALFVTLLMLALLPSVAAAQEARYTLAFRGVPLDEALTRFADATGTALAFDPELVYGHRAYCRVEEAAAEELLACLLEVSGLDYLRLSSGTYVVTEPRAAERVVGHLTGLVTDRASGAPLPGAHVYLADAGRGAVANEAGRFLLPDLLPGRHAVQVSYLGYASWRDTLYVAAEAGTRADVALEPKTVLVTPVVVDGMRQRLASEAQGRSIAEGVGSVAGRPGAGSYEAAVMRPGLRSSVFGGLHVQGGDYGAHALRLDGVPVYQPQLPGLASPFAASALERVTVEKAGFDAALGSQTAAVLRAEHALGSTPMLDVQVDPLAIDGRVQAVLGDVPARQLSVMTAARIGLWGLATPSALREALDTWSRPDLFLLSTGRPDAEVVLPRGTAGEDEPRSVDYADVHAAARLRLGPTRTIHASGYVGQRALGGAHDAFVTPDVFYGRESVALVTAQDRYEWHNRLAQVRYEALVGRRTFAGVQARASTYALEHDYRVVDSLTVDDYNNITNVQGMTPVNDGNGITTFAVEGALDHARGNHQGRVVLEAAWTEASFDLYGPRFGGAGVAQPQLNEDVLPGRLAVGQSVLHEASGWRVAAAATDRWQLASGVGLDGGVRLTYLATRGTVYAEPRLALRLDGSSPVGSWAARTAAGLYRQYEGRYRASVLDVGALLPALDVWLPLDASVRPPVSYHLAQDVVLRPSPQFTVSAEAYYKHQPHQMVLRYAGYEEPGRVGRVREQADFLQGASGYAWGVATTLAWQDEHLRAEVLYERSAARRCSAGLFDGRSVPVPWDAPHHAAFGLDAHLTSRFTVSTRAQGTWGRSWGFRRTYYDYFGQDADTRRHGAIDLGHPEQHRLPPLLTADVGLAYTRVLGLAQLQLQVDVRNVFDRLNVLDWRLVQRDDDAFDAEPRRLPGRVPTFAVRLVL